MGWTIKLNSNARVCEGEGLLSPGAEDVMTPIIEKLNDAAGIVPNMLDIATKCLKKGSLVAEQNRKDPFSTPILRFVREALHKYFCLNPNDGNWNTVVNRIATVYEQVDRGVGNDYNIYIYKVQPGQDHYDANAYVPGSELPKKADVRDAIGSAAALSRFFIVNPDYHWPWEEVQKFALLGHTSTWIQKREIHLNFDYILKEESTSDIIAKTIIHEGTHKWAYTNDVCYKASTYSSKQIGDSGDLVEEYMRQGFLEKVERSVEREDGKSLYAFAAVNKKIASYPKNVLQTNPAWVNNADSYAWAARRLWKLRYQLAL